VMVNGRKVTRLVTPAYRPAPVAPKGCNLQGTAG